MVVSAAVFALVSVVIFSVTSVYTKFLIPQLGGPYKFLATQLTIGGVFTTAILLFSGDTIPQDLLHSQSVQLEFLISSLFAFFGFLTLMQGFAKGNASVGGIFISSRLIISIPTAFIFLGEKFPPYIYLFIFVTFIGAIIVSWDESLSLGDVLFFRAKGVKWFLMTMIFWALSNVFIRKLSPSLSTVQFIAYRQLVMIALVWIFWVKFHAYFDPEDKKVTLTKVRNVVLYLLMTLTAQFLFVYALQQSLTLSEGIGVFEGVSTFLVSLLFAKFYGNEVLQEQLSKRGLIIRSVGVVLATSGTLLIILTQQF